MSVDFGGTQPRVHPLIVVNIAYDSSVCPNEHFRVPCSIFFLSYFFFLCAANDLLRQIKGMHTMQNMHLRVYHTQQTTCKQHAATQIKIQ